MKIFVAGGTGAIGRPLTAELLAKGHAIVALTRSEEKARALAEQGIEPAVAWAAYLGWLNLGGRAIRAELAAALGSGRPAAFTEDAVAFTVALLIGVALR
ncbi:MAG: NAD(P)H-binding protein [Blastocatellia bacterium]